MSKRDELMTAAGSLSVAFVTAAFAFEERGSFGVILGIISGLAVIFGAYWYVRGVRN
jgi:hypothetical protein